MHTSWYRNGAKAIEGQYRDGKREGAWHRWDPNGFKQWTEVYKDGLRVSGDVANAPGIKTP
jgi:antitoxin component YwqK of YwqJK toxin-antitoxin module